MPITNDHLLLRHQILQTEWVQGKFYIISTYGNVSDLYIMIIIWSLYWYYGYCSFVITAISKGQERLPLRLKKIFLRFLHVTFGNEEGHLQEKQLIQLLMALLLKGLEKKETQVQLVEIVTIENPVVEKVVEIEIIETVKEDLGHQGKYILI